MIITDIDLLRIVTGSSAGMDIACEFDTYTPGVSNVQNTQNTHVVSVTTTTIISKPTSGDAVRVSEITIKNIGGVPNSVTVQLYNGTTSINITNTVVLNANCSLVYIKGKGWYSLDEIGNPEPTGRTYIVRTEQMGDADIIAQPGTCYYIPNGAFTTTKQLILTNMTQEGDYIEIKNEDETYALVPSSTVYFAGGDAVDSIYARQTTPIRRIRGVFYVI